MAVNFFELEIGFNESNADEIYNELYLYGITSIIEENGIIRVSLPEQDILVLESIMNNLIERKIVKEHSIYISQFENKDWNKEWEKTIDPVVIKDKIIIYPSWKKESFSPTKDIILIEIDPKMSFGTGHNETTQLILELMADNVDSSDKYMLDYGCGTGILAIAGVKLGIENAVAIDIDEDSVENAKEYIKQNNTENKIKVYKSDITGITEDKFDIICANITSGIIIPDLKNIYNKLKFSGKLFITGILIEEKSEMLSELENNGFIIKKTIDKAEWTGIYSVKKRNMRKTVIDIGTNTMLMLIADFDETNFKLNSILDIQRVPRLGKGVDSNRNILAESIEKAVVILDEYKEISSSYNSASIKATATSFIRDSQNKVEFTGTVQAKTGINIEILSGEEESRWTFWGGVFDKLQNNSSEKIVTIDIGGGSTEITTTSDIPNNLNKIILLNHPIKGKSLDVGSVRLNEKFLSSHPPAYSNVAQTEMFINEHLSQINIDLKQSNLIGVAGTITTLGAIKLGLDKFIAEEVDGLLLSIEDIEHILNDLSSMSLEEIYSLGNYMEGRADIILPGTLILKCFMNKFGFEKVLVSTKGLRYGILLRESLF